MDANNTASTTLESRLLGCAKAAFKVDTSAVTEATLLNTLGDSLDFVDFLGDVEKEFRIELSNERVADLRTVGDLLEAVRQSVAHHPAG